MPVLVDGNNLLFAARAVADPGRPIPRSILCETLGRWAVAVRDRVHVVFDGPEPPRGLAEQIGDQNVDVTYSGALSADAVIIDLVNGDSAPRRLWVVSTDREIMRNAKRRKARPIRSQDFWQVVTAELARPPRPVLEPPQKRGGLVAGETEAWLADFGFAESEPESRRVDPMDRPES